MHNPVERSAGTTQTIAICTKRWRWWPHTWPLGEKWSRWEKEQTREEAERYARGLREMGALYAEVVE